jgi:hypothetical protein
MSILCLIIDKDRRVQAELCFREAIRMGLKDIEILEEIGDLYVKGNQYNLAIESYIKVTQI